jgi:mono/diheme cytochrome c family protein
VRQARRGGLIAVLAAGLLVTGAAAGCGDDGGSAEEPTTAAATAVPPTTSAPAAPTETIAPATTTETAPAGTGDVAAGEAVFASTCQGCHADLGHKAAFGPKLAGLGLSAETIRTTVVNGRSPMPAGLVSGTDLDNVVAYVESIQ